MTKMLDDLTAEMMAKNLRKRIYEVLELNGYEPDSNSQILINQLNKVIGMGQKSSVRMDIMNPLDEHDAKMNFLEAFKVYYDMGGIGELRDITDILYRITEYGDLEIHESCMTCPYCDHLGALFVCVEELSCAEVWRCGDCGSYWRVLDKDERDS